MHVELLSCPELPELLNHRLEQEPDQLSGSAIVVTDDYGAATMTASATVTTRTIECAPVSYFTAGVSPGSVDYVPAAVPVIATWLVGYTQPSFNLS